MTKKEAMALITGTYYYSKSTAQFKEAQHCVSYGRRGEENATFKDMMKEAGGRNGDPIHKQ